MRSVIRFLPANAALIVLFAASACNRDNPKGEAPSALDASPAAAHVAASASLAKEREAPSLAGSEKRGPSREKRPLSDSEKANLKTYRSSLAAGRKATVDKNYTKAIEAFDAALAARPQDPRALSERGYARLLARDFTAAQDDFEQSARLTSDEKLLASIRYNEGLLAEARGDASAAQTYFARSNALNPTNAARAKLKGQSKCPAEVTKTQVRGRFVETWKAAWANLTAAYAKEHGAEGILEKPTSDAEVKKLICDGGDCRGAGPWVVTYGGPESGVRYFVATAPDNKLALVSLGTYSYSSCGGAYKAEILGASLYTVRSEETFYIRGGFEREVQGRKVPCDENEPGEDCFSACTPVDSVRVVQFVDASAPSVVLTVSTDANSAHAPLVTAKESNGTVTISGAGCSESIKLK
jgi:tetratricopeptide (TPR) repeat protein